MITMTSNIAEIHGTRPWLPVACSEPVAKPHRSVPILGGLDFYNSTGVSAVEGRHR